MMSMTNMADFSKFRVTGELSDVSVDLDGQVFQLHKFPLYIKSDYFRERFGESSPDVQAVDKVELEEFPGGGAVFDQVANFCYNMKIDITVENICHLRCAAEYLKMTGRGNLIDLTDRFIQDTLTGARLARDYSTILNLIHQCRLLVSTAGYAPILEACITAMIDCWLLTSAGVLRKSRSHGNLWVPDKQVEDLLCKLPTEWFLKMYREAKEKSVRPAILAKVMQVYINGVVKSATSSEDGTQAETEPSPSLATQGNTKETKETSNETPTEVEAAGEEGEIEIAATKNNENEEEDKTGSDSTPVDDPSKQGTSSPVAQRVDILIAELPDNVLVAEAIDPQWAIQMLHFAQANGCKCLVNLRKLVSRVIHRLSPGELVQQPAELVADLLRQSCDDDNEGSAHQEEVTSSLVDAYLSELATNNRLTADIFHQMVVAVPQDHRYSHDTLFRVLESLLKSDKFNLSEEDKLTMIGCIDYERLSEKSLQHAFEADIVPQTYITKAALALCTKLRTELEDAQAVIKEQGEELNKYSYQPTATKPLTSSYRSPSQYYSDGSAKHLGRLTTYDLASSPRVRHAQHSYSSTRGVPSLASDAELDLVLESLDRTSYDGDYSRGLAYPSGNRLLVTQGRYSTWRGDTDYTLESPDNYRPKDRSSFRSSYGRNTYY